MTRKEDPGLWWHEGTLEWVWANVFCRPHSHRKRVTLLLALFVLVCVPIVYAQSGDTIKEEVVRQGNINTYLLALITVMMAIIGWFLKGLVGDIRTVKDEYIRMNVVQQQQVKDIDKLEAKPGP